MIRSRRGLAIATIVMVSCMSFTVDEAVLAHPGGLDKNGCHHDRKSGGYHCHGGGASSGGGSSSGSSSPSGGSQSQPGPGCSNSGCAGLPVAAPPIQQEVATLSGKVFGPANTPLTEVKVKAVSKTESKPYERELVAIDGTFSLADLPVGASIEMTASKDGFQPNSMTLTVQQGANAYNVTLLSAAAPSASPISAPAAAASTPASPTP